MEAPGRRSWRWAALQFFGPQNVPDVWPAKKVSPTKMVHLTENPVELARRAIDYSSLPGEAGALSAPRGISAIAAGMSSQWDARRVPVVHRWRGPT